MLSFLNIQKIQNKLEIGEIFFLLGILFLPFAIPIGALFLLISLIISYSLNYQQIFKDKWNYPIFMSLGIILMSTINASIVNPSIELLKYDKSNIWINLFNWIPILFGFLGFQTYLKTYYQKIRFAKFLLLGTVPVIISCVMQFNLRFFGPFKTFYGLIIWFQYPLRESSGAVTGLFSNQNYTACFLSITLPFALLALKHTKNNLNKLILTGFNLLNIYFLFFTFSRNGLLSLTIISFCYLGIKRIFLTLSSLSITFFILNILGLLKEYLNPSISGFDVTNLVSNALAFSTSTRFQIWNTTISFISKKPLLGWGASTFSHLFEYHNETILPPIRFYDTQHSHNLFLELAHNFGLPLALLILITLIILIFRVLKVIKISEHSFDYFINRTWLISSLLAILYQITDLTYYDGKISLLICILLSGMRTILPMKTNQKNSTIKEY